MSSEAAAVFEKVFYSYDTSRRGAVVSGGNRFVHYTRADTAIKILRNREIWLRNAQLMNDFSEIQHGYDCLRGAVNSEAGKEFLAVLGRLDAQLPERLLQQFDSYLPAVFDDTFIFCLSEHLSSEDVRGRLSMWRAYGGRSGVALVLHGTQMHAATTALAAYSSPVLYADAASFAEHFAGIVARMKQNEDALSKFPIADLASVVDNVLRYALLCTKHPGFEEEREWRVLASPTFQTSERLRSSIECIGVLPQRVLKISLENDHGAGLFALGVPELLDRVIIGPCENPRIVADAFREVLRELNIENPEAKVVISDVPLRHAD